jgi:hypothetical protein
MTISIDKKDINEWTIGQIDSFCNNDYKSLLLPWRTRNRLLSEIKKKCHLISTDPHRWSPDDCVRANTYLCKLTAQSSTVKMKVTIAAAVVFFAALFYNVHEQFEDVNTHQAQSSH